jgi:hypothetical protein
MLEGMKQSPRAGLCAVLINSLKPGAESFDFGREAWRRAHHRAAADPYCTAAILESRSPKLNFRYRMSANQQEGRRLDCGCAIAMHYLEI